jgi:glycosyltransferase involved in cell wall biosynthesis
LAGAESIGEMEAPEHRRSISVVIPAYRAWTTLPRVLDALEPQIDGSTREAILVESSDPSSAEDLGRSRPWLKVIALPERTRPGRARNIALQRVRGDVIAFLDADAVPEQNWLDELDDALVPGLDAVAGAVLNGTPRSAVGTAGFLLEFSSWLPDGSRTIDHGASCNLLVRREALEGEGGFLDDLWPGEDTVLTVPFARRRGLGFAPNARVRHVNRTGLREFLRHQRRLGASFAAVCAHVDVKHRWIARGRSWALLSVPLRLAAVAARLRRNPREAAAATRVLPLLVLGLAAWAVGLGEASR